MESIPHWDRRELMKGWVYWYMCIHTWTHTYTQYAHMICISKYIWIHEKGSHSLGTRDIVHDMVESIHAGIMFCLPPRPLPHLLDKLTQAWSLGGRTGQDLPYRPLSRDIKVWSSLNLIFLHWPGLVPEVSCVSVGRLWVWVGGSMDSEYTSGYFSNSDQTLKIQKQLPKINSRNEELRSQNI